MRVHGEPTFVLVRVMEGLLSGDLRIVPDALARNVINGSSYNVSIIAHVISEIVMGSME